MPNWERPLLLVNRLINESQDHGRHIDQGAWRTEDIIVSSQAARDQSVSASKPVQF